MSGRSSEENSILNSVSDGITITSQGIISYVNSTFAEMVGYTVSELIGMSVYDLVAPDYRELVKERTKSRQHGKDVVSIYEIELERRDGSRFPVELSISRIDYNGKSSSLTIIRDITERKKAKDELENLFNLSPDMQCICTPEGEFISVNLACEKILGYTTDEIVKLGWANLVHPDDMKSTTNEVDEQQEGYSVSNFINRFRSKDGSYKTLEWQASPVINGIVYATARDITERRRSEERLSALHSFALELDLAESIGEVTETTFRIMKEVLGFQYSSFQLLKEEGLVSVGVTDNIKLGTVFPLKGKGITTRAAREAHTMLVGDVRFDSDFIKGSTDSRSELAVPILNEDGVLGVLNVESLMLDAFSEDDAKMLEILAQNVASALNRIQAAEDRMELEIQVIAEQVRVEQEQELSELKTQIMNTATHELRTPVTSILGYLELILSDPDRDVPADIRKDLEVVVRNANRLATFTNDLLDVQRLTSGKFKIKHEKVDLVNTVTETLRELSHMFAEKHQVVDFVSPKELYVTVDELRISQIFINLLRNANKYTPEEGIITVTVEPSDGHVLVSVKDTGVGLSEEDMGKLFSPFPEIRKSLGVTSTGLGLAICKGIVDLHDGEIWVESDGHGKGSTFHVKLPYEP